MKINHLLKISTDLIVACKSDYKMNALYSFFNEDYKSSAYYDTVKHLAFSKYVSRKHYNLAQILKLKTIARSFGTRYSNKSIFNKKQPKFQIKRI